MVGKRGSEVVQVFAFAVCEFEQKVGLQQRKVLVNVRHNGENLGVDGRMECGREIGGQVLEDVNEYVIDGHNVDVWILSIVRENGFVLDDNGCLLFVHDSTSRRRTMFICV